MNAQRRPAAAAIVARRTVAALAASTAAPVAAQPPIRGRALQGANRCDPEGGCSYDRVPV